MLNFLNQNSGAFSVIFAGLVVGATIVYAILTRRLVIETEKVREAQTEPKVCVFIEPRGEILQFVAMAIQNVGPGIAHDIRFEVKPDFKIHQGVRFSELNLIRNGLKYLAPNQKFQFFLTFISSNETEPTEPKEQIQPFEVKVTYRSSTGKEYQDTYWIDLSPFLDLRLLGESSLSHELREIPRELRAISRGVEALSKAIQALKR